MSTHRAVPVTDGNTHPLSVPSDYVGGPADHNAPSFLVIREYPIYDQMLLRKSDDFYVVAWEVRAGVPRLVSVVRHNKTITH